MLLRTDDLADRPVSRTSGRLFLSMLTTAGAQAGIVALLLVAGHHALASQAADVAIRPPMTNFVFLSTPVEAGGGGGGGGGNQMPEPPRAAQLPGRDRVTVPAGSVTPTLTLVETPEVPRIDVPVMTLASDAMASVGLLQAPQGPPSASQGPGRGGGAGDGDGTGVGPGRGPGLGPGSGGNMGDGPVRPGVGILNPVPITRVEPVYTPSAAEKRIEGEVWVECVVTTKGVCANARVVRSLDARFGLDQAALVAAEKWRFRPGIERASGRPVDVLVSIGISFSIR